MTQMALERPMSVDRAKRPGNMFERRCLPTCEKATNGEPREIKEITKMQKGCSQVARAPALKTVFARDGRFRKNVGG